MEREWVEAEEKKNTVFRFRQAGNRKTIGILKDIMAVGSLL